MFSIFIYKLLCTFDYQNDFSFFLVNKNSYAFYSNLYFIDSNLYTIHNNVMFLFFNEYKMFFFNSFLQCFTFEYVFNSYIIDCDFFFIKVFFFTKSSISTIDFEFICLQDLVFVSGGETTLIFFRINNESNYYIDCFTVYIVYPIHYSYALTKLQCFCFSNLSVLAYESLELPVLFYINTALFNELSIPKLYFFYLIVCTIV